MFVPIVRRSVTVTVREVFHYSFQCDACRLSTWGHVQAEGVGRRSTAYVTPDRDAAQMRAHSDAQQRSMQLFSQVPCPRCAAPGLQARAALQAWEQKGIDRARIRRRALLVGLVVTLVLATGCGAAVAAQDTKGSVGAGVFLGVGWLVVGALASLIAYGLAGSPGPRPVLLAQVPPGVWFDPPPAGG